MKALARALVPTIVALAALEAQAGSRPLALTQTAEPPTISRSLTAEFSKATPRLGLDGCCPVTVLSFDRWRRGDERFAAVYDNRAYYFASSREHEVFLRNPQAYAPLLDGCDPYFAVTKQVWKTGDRRYGIVYQGRIVLFASSESRDEFIRAPEPIFAKLAVSPPDPFRSMITAPRLTDLPAGIASTESPPPAKIDSATKKLDTAQIETLLPDGSPPLGLDGYCPVTLLNGMVWRRGDLRFGAVHCGRTYLFADAAKQKEFLADPDRFAPYLRGYDPYFAAQSNVGISGKREYGLVYQGRVMLFVSPESYGKFVKDPERYLKAIESSALLKLIAAPIRR